MRRYAVLAFVATVVLGAAAVLLGGLNQDEGWYLYAADLVASGRMPYRDFAYTQGPLLPVVYSLFGGIWHQWGLLGARVLTLALGLCSIALAAGAARELCGGDRVRARMASLTVWLLLGGNLYHLYYLSIPKTYALGALLVNAGAWLFARAAGAEDSRRRAAMWMLSGVAFAFAAGARVSLGAAGAVLFVALACVRRRFPRAWLWFAAGGAAGAAVAYGPFVLDSAALSGLLDAQRYHAQRGGFSPVFVVGSLSRLVRYYAGIFVVAGLAVAAWRRGRRADGAGPGAGPMLAAAFFAVFALQMLAPFPYEDYQVPVMALLAAPAAALFARGCADGRQSAGLLLALGLSWSAAFGSPLLERWTTDGQDRFWTVRKERPELFQLRDAAARIEALDPGGDRLLTQDLYLAIETHRRVPEGLEMGPFSCLDDASWRRLLATCDAPVAALSGYTFAVRPPVCDERPLDEQLEYWRIVSSRYEAAAKIPRFGQNATTLMILKRKDP